MKNPTKNFQKTQKEPQKNPIFIKQKNKKWKKQNKKKMVKINN